MVGLVLQGHCRVLWLSGRDGLVVSGIESGTCLDDELNSLSVY